MTIKGIQMDAFADLLPAGSAPAIGVAEVLAQLKAWSEAGAIRRLDSAFASFLHELDPGLSPVVALSGALVAHMEGRGHACLPVEAALLSFDDEGLPGWPPAALAELRTLLSGLPATAEGWLDALRRSAVVFAESLGEDHQQPLVLDGHRLYLRRHWRAERRIARQVLGRVVSDHPVDAAQVRAWLDVLFGPPSPDAQSIDWQKLACGIAVRRGLSLITGGPGTGKTYTVARLLALLYALDPEPRAMRVALAAPTGKAAARLKQAIDVALDGLQRRLGGEVPHQGATGASFHLDTDAAPSVPPAASAWQLRELAARIGPARTLHSLLGARPDTRRFRHDATHPLEVDVLIVDEASMIHLEMMASLLDAVRPGARIILLGDKDQLASVEAGAVLGDLCRHAQAGRYDAATRAYAQAVTGQAIPTEFADDVGPLLAQQTVMLRESRRFSGPIGHLASAVNKGDAEAASTLMRGESGGALSWLEGPSLSMDAVVRLALRGRDGAPGGYGDYLGALRRRPGPGLADPAAHTAWVREVLGAFDKFRLLCAVREGEWGVAGVNHAVERALAAQGGLPLRTGGAWYEGRPVMVTRNDAAAGVFNGDIGIALAPPAEGAPLRVYFLDGHDVRSVAVSRLADVETAFAMTVHKSQGSEFDHTVLVLQQDNAAKMLTRELLYTGITRARTALTLVLGNHEVFAQALGRTTRRASGLPRALGDVDEDRAVVTTVG